MYVSRFSQFVLNMLINHVLFCDVCSFSFWGLGHFKIGEFSLRIEVGPV